MRWNVVGRARDEMAEATADWNSGGTRFGETRSSMGQMLAPQPLGPTGSR